MSQFQLGERYDGQRPAGSWDFVLEVEGHDYVASKAGAEDLLRVQAALASVLDAGFDELAGID